MLIALSQQSVPSLLLNALVRGIIFTVVIQLIALASGLTTSGVAQMLILVLIFTLLTFSVDLIEKYWAQSRLSSRDQNLS
jgi:hypothetical protein